MPKVVAGYKLQARARIVEAARAVFHRKGLARATMEDIAKEIGVSKGALYLYFRTKSELLAAIQAQFRQEVLGSWEALLDEGDVAEGIAHSLDTVFSGEVDPAVWHELLTEAASDPEVRATLELDQREDSKMMRRFLKRLQIRGRIRPMEDLEAVTDVVLMLLQGTAARIMMKGLTGDAHERLVRSLRLVLGTSRPSGRAASPR
ncbi:MAG: helix-turn-helix domain-containing protein [Thermoplasmata archaeon]